MNRKTKAYILIFIGFVIGAISVFIGQEVFTKSIDTFFNITVALILIFAIITIIVVISWKKIISLLFGKVVEIKNEVEDDLEGVVSGVLDSNKLEATNSVKNLSEKVLRYIVWRDTKANLFLIFQSLFILMGAIVGSIFIRNQNDLIKIQNNLIEKEIVRLDQQTYLQEAERRSGLVFLFSNIMDLLDQELKEDYNSDGIRNISPQLSGRIISLSQRLQPYKFLDGDTLSKDALSPERGQLLINILKSDLDQETLDILLSESNFQYSLFSGITFSKVALNSIDLSYSTFNRVTFDSVIFNDAVFDKVNFNKISFNTTVFSFAQFENSKIGIAGNHDLSLEYSDLINSVILEEEFSFIGNNFLGITHSDVKNSVINGSFDILDLSDSKISNLDLIGESKKMNIQNTVICNSVNWLSSFAKYVENPYKEKYVRRWSSDTITYDYLICNSSALSSLKHLAGFSIESDTITSYGLHIERRNGYGSKEDTLEAYAILSPNQFDENGLLNPYSAYRLSKRYLPSIDNSNFNEFLDNRLSSDLQRALSFIDTEYLDSDTTLSFFRRAQAGNQKALEIFFNYKDEFPKMFWWTYIDVLTLDFLIAFEEKASLEYFKKNYSLFLSMQEEMNEARFVYDGDIFEEVKMTLVFDRYKEKEILEYVGTIKEVYGF